MNTNNLTYQSAISVANIGATNKDSWVKAKGILGVGQDFVALNFGNQDRTYMAMNVNPSPAFIPKDGKIARTTRGVDSWIKESASAIAQNTQSLFSNVPSTGNFVDRLKTTDAGRFSIMPAIEAASQFPMGGISSAVSGTATAAFDVANKAGSAMAGAAQNFADGAGDLMRKADVNGFIASSVETFEAIQNIGEEFDKLIEETFLGQLFEIKGHEIICATFCLIISLLSCKERNGLYNAIKDIKDAMNNANAAVDEINNLTKTALEAPVVDGNTISAAVGGLFQFGGQFARVPNTSSTKSYGNIYSDLQQSRDAFIKKNIQSSEAAKGTRKPNAKLTLIPESAKTTINTIVSILSVLTKGQISVPVGVEGKMWSLVESVMFMVQMAVVQAADEFLARIVNSIEDKLKKIKVQVCLGNIAVRIVKKVVESVKLVKDWIIEQLKELFGSAEGFKIKWKTFGWYFGELQELLQLLKALNLVLKKFPELALLCGVTACNDTTDPPNKQIGDLENAIRAQNLSDIFQTNAPAKILSEPLKEPDPNNPRGVDELKKIASNVFSVDPTLVSFDPTNDSFSVVAPCLFQDAPNMIRGFLTQDGFLQELGSAYTICPNEDPNSPGAYNGIDVVYTYKSACSVENK